MRRALAVPLLAALIPMSGGRPAPALTWFLPDGRQPGRATPAEQRRAVAFVTAARSATADLADPVAAERAGYEPQSQGQIVHFLDVERLVPAGAAPDPDQPTALVFVAAGGTLRLAGAMWMMATAGARGTDFGGPLTPWHAHVECRSGWTIRLVAVGSACRPGETRSVTPEMLHVWLAGVADPFASDMSAPALVCDLAGANPRGRRTRSS